MTFFLPQGRALEGARSEEVPVGWVTREVWMMVRA